MIRFAARFLAVWSLAVSCLRASDSDPLRFRITLARDVTTTTVSGRMLVFMSSAPSKPSVIGTGFVPGQVSVAAMEIEAIKADQTIEFDPDIKAYPQPFSKAKAGTYHFMALLDRDHSYAYNGPGPGDIRSDVITVETLDPSNAKPVELTLARVAPDRPDPPDSESAKIVSFRSPRLTAFWGRPITMKATVVLPPKYSAEPAKRYPVAYHVHGFGGTYRTFGASRLVDLIKQGKRADMAHVFLDASFSTGHHVFADSVNNGPWGAALTREFIPWLESRFRFVPRPYARFLTGHSSGGWSTLWLQVAYPDFFGGTWSTSPDPVDLRAFTGVNATPGSADNAYRTKDGKGKGLVRFGGRDVVTFEEFTKQEEVVGEFGGQIASFEWVFSQRGPDGRPMKMFNRETGELNQEVLKHWQKYDIRKVLETNWATLGPKLRKKVNVICGLQDTFHLEEGLKLLKEFFGRVRADVVCELIPGRDHGNLYAPYTTYPEGLDVRIDQEMWASYHTIQSNSKGATK